MLRERFSILLVVPDQDLATEISTQIHKHFERLPLHLDFATDGVKALYYLNRYFHHLVISMVDMPIMDGPTLVHEIRKDHGSTVIYLLSKKKVEIEESGVELLPLPITDINKFCSKVLDVVPEEMKAKFGLRRAESLTLRKLNQYAKDTLPPSDKENFKGEAFAMIAGGFTSQSSGVVKQASQKEDIRESTQQNFTGQRIAEGIWLGLLLILSAYVVATSPESESTNLLTLKNGVVLFTFVIFSGYFATHIFERIMVRSKK